MPTCRTICKNALIEIGACAQGETPSAGDLQNAFYGLQRQLDAWQADALTLAVQAREVFTVTSGTSEVTIGVGGDIVAMRPVFVDGINYIIPGSSPEVEVPIGPMDRDQYMALSIKELQSQLPLASFYQTSIDTVLGTIFLWPQVSQDVDIAIYYPKGVGVPATVDDVLIGPPGYLEGFHYQLSERLLIPFAVGNQLVISQVKEMSREAYARLKRPNTQPGLMGVDAALMPMSGGAYNVLSDGYTGSSSR